MKLNDKESYVVREKILDSAHKGVYGEEVPYGISLQINRRPHVLFYDDEKTRDVDFDLIAKTIGA